MAIFYSRGLLVSDKGWPLTYPVGFSALGRRRIDDALRAAAASATLPATRANAPRRAVTGPVRGRLFASEDAAVEAVLEVFEVVVHVLSMPRDDHDPGTQRRVADSLFDELVVWIADLTPSVTMLDGFADRVRGAREKCTWWTEAFKVPASDVPVKVVPASPSDDDSPPISIQEAAKRLNCHVDTLKRWAKDGVLKVTRVGKRLKVRLADVKELLDNPKYRYR